MEYKICIEDQAPVKYLHNPLFKYFGVIKWWFFSADGEVVGCYTSETHNWD